MKLNPDAALDYMDFVVERHRVWELRQAGEPQPWTDDPLLQRKKFTNVFRVLDYGSQYVIRELLPGASWLDTVFRTVLYRKTNRPEPWVAFQAEFGRVPEFEDATDGELLEFWQDYRASGRPLFSGAYRQGRTPINSNRLSLIVGEMRVIPALAGRLEQQTTLAGRLSVIKKLVPRCSGDFISMQMATDLGYSAWVRGDEDETVLTGPGSESGLSVLFPDSFRVRDGGTGNVKLAEQALREVSRWWAENPDCPRLQLPDGRTREPSLMDLQNTFCEFFKYNRAKGQPERKPYRPTHPGLQPDPVLPAHW